MRYTEFGEYFKILRIKHQEVLMDAKKFLGVSCAFISSVECGKRPIPEDWFSKIVNHYRLTDLEQDELKDAIDKSKKFLKLDMESVTNVQKDLAIQFQRSFDGLDEKKAKEILDIIKRNQ
ncbi:MAG: XRE family transcriptional regulator [Bacilli bacterium]|nr:XRE family transcriptional regulator [Bacilli bacterium]